MKEEFFVLIRDEKVIAVNWKEHGPSGVFAHLKPEEKDRVLLVRSALEEYSVGIKLIEKKRSDT